MWRLFLDDQREPVTEGWEVARSSYDAINLVQRYGSMPIEIAFDFDLGGDDTAEIFVNWLVDAILDGDIQIPEDFAFSVHSQNSVGGPWIKHKMNAIIAFKKGS